MGYDHAQDEGLPEVVADPSPQAVTSAEEQYQYHQQHKHDKYPVVYDDAPKLPSEATGLPHSVDRSPGGSVPWEPLAAGDSTTSGQENNSEKAEDEPRICGIRRKVFFLLFFAALVVVAAAIGGGVGGGIAGARSREGSGSAASSSITSSPSAQASNTTPSSTPPTSTMSGAAPTATFLNNQTGPLGFGFQGFSGVNYTGEATQIFRDEGFFDLGIDCLSYVWLPNTTSCCITFCADHHNATGYRCQIRKQEKASDAFPRIYIWCDPGLAGKANSTCS